MTNIRVGLSEDEARERVLDAWFGVTDSQEWFTCRDKMRPVGHEWQVIHNTDLEVNRDETMAIVAEFATMTEAEDHAERLRLTAQADAALKAFGFHDWPQAAALMSGEAVVAPSVPTEAMCDAGWIDKEDVSPREIYSAMLAAAPASEKEHGDG